MREIIKQSKAQTCYILRNNNYLRKRFAILSFKSQEALENASNLQTFLGNTELQWLSLEIKTCTICSNSNHLAKDCPLKNNKSKNPWEKRKTPKNLGIYISDSNPQVLAIPNKSYNKQEAQTKNHM